MRRATDLISIQRRRSADEPTLQMEFFCSVALLSMRALRDGAAVSSSIPGAGVIAAPRGQVETNPTPDFTPTVMAGRDVDSAAMPTAETAVIVASDGGRVALDGLADPFRAAWSLIESPYGLVVRPPWSVVLGPLPARYEVLPQTASAVQAGPAIVEPALGE